MILSANNGTEKWTNGRERAINPHKKLFTNVSIEVLGFGIDFVENID